MRELCVNCSSSEIYDEGIYCYTLDKFVGRCSEQTCVLKTVPFKKDEMCNNECVLDGNCKHNEECYDEVYFSSEQMKVINKWLTEERKNVVDSFKEKMRNLYQLNCFVDYVADEIDLEELMYYASEEIAEQLKER